ncbi:MAG: CRTAC1 family protein [Acidobacteriota bacterium]
MWLEEAEESSGFVFVHDHGGRGERHMMETMGSGVAIVDVDGDGWMDVYFVQSGPVPWNISAEDPHRPNVLLRNRGDGTFDNVTEASGAGDTGYGMGVCAGDVDNDADVDLFVTNFGPDVLLRNRGDGTFDDVSEAAGVDDPLWSVGCAFADIDLDGDLDLFVVRYVNFSEQNQIRCTIGDQVGYCHPDVYHGVPDLLYRNRGDGTFEDITETAGIGVDDPEESKGLGVLWLDADDDGLPDAYVANDSTRNFLWRNRGDGTFEDIAIGAGAAFNNRGQTEAGMGVAAADFDGDGLEDLVVTHLDYETNTLYRRSGEAAFDDLTDAAGLGGPSILHVGFGAVFFDFELDGDPDLFVANGHIIDNVSLEAPHLSYPQQDQLFENRLVGEQGDSSTGRFVDISERAGPYFARKLVGRGVARGDLDNDGDEDLVISNSNEPAVLLWNRAGDSGRSLQLRLLDAHGRDAVGAVARLEASAPDGTRRLLVGTVRAGASYASQHDPRLVFGLGDATLESLTITWPGGGAESIAAERLGLDVDQGTIVLRQPS